MDNKKQKITKSNVSVISVQDYTLSVSRQFTPVNKLVRRSLRFTRRAYLPGQYICFYPANSCKHMNWLEVAFKEGIFCSFNAGKQ